MVLAGKEAEPWLPNPKPLWLSMIPSSLVCCVNKKEEFQMGNFQKAHKEFSREGGPRKECLSSGVWSG